MITTWLSTIYLLTAAALSVYGCLGLLTLALYWRHRRDTFPCPVTASDALPAVTVQLPIFNERYVVDRLLAAAVRLDYPRDRLQIQVLDDSTDDTSQIAAGLVADYAAQGLDICLIRRLHRQGFKAGALAAGLEQARGEFVAVFDADFQPDADFLQQTIPHFLADSRLGMVQVRWGHLNAADSPLTAAQAIALDKHFAMEQTVRHRADLFPKFNGTAGVWRRATIEAVGGWQDDTVCEDLCLSTRAILAGWRFLFLNDVVAPAELPASIAAYKNQQARWAKGSSQCLLKFGGQILSSESHSLTARLYAVLAMSAYTTHLLLLTLLLLLGPLLYLNFQFSPRWIVLGLAGMGQPLLFVLGQRVLHPDWRRRLKYFPAMLLIAIGLAPISSRAILQALFNRRHTFVRTPKGGGAPTLKHGRYQLPFDWIILVEISLALYAALSMVLALMRQNFGPLLLLATCTLGFTYVTLLGIRERFQPDY
jgi:cellulose synthase/poly-beta-1,6-N-acetylglucosamine synthase-like glycosyltransferase